MPHWRSRLRRSPAGGCSRSTSSTRSSARLPRRARRRGRSWSRWLTAASARIREAEAARRWLNDAMGPRRRTGILVLILLVTTMGASGSPVAAAEDAVLVGAGDIADCASPGDEATAMLLAGI